MVRNPFLTAIIIRRSRSSIQFLPFAALLIGAWLVEGYGRLFECSNFSLKFRLHIAARRAYARALTKPSSLIRTENSSCSLLPQSPNRQTCYDTLYTTLPRVETDPQNGFLAAVEMPEMLCPTCRSIFSWDEKLWPRKKNLLTGFSSSLKDNTLHGRCGKYHDSRYSLEASAHAGCHLCATVWGSLTKKKRARIGNGAGCSGALLWELSGKDSRGKDPNLWDLRKRLYEGPDVCFMIFGFPPRGKNAGKGFIEGQGILTMTIKRENTAYFWQNDWQPFNVETVENSTNSDHSWALAMKWLNECKDAHSKCNSEKTPGWKPSRLVAIEEIDPCPDLARIPHLRLSTLEDVPDDVEYMTLSHCWGMIAMNVLTTKNVDDFKMSIPWSQLTKTFQDAVLATKRLGIKYIWIDSLCILQDSLEDWQHESGVMEYVYSNSYLNIAATSAPDGRRGCYHDRTPLFINPCEITLSWVRGDEPEKRVLSDTDSWFDIFDQEPLNQRAWVIQERALSPRVLHFTSSQLIWECNECILCEKWPIKTVEQGTKFTSFSGTSTRTSPLKMMYLTKADDKRRDAEKDEDINFHFRAWNAIVESYTGCGLTKDTDKLIALSGIARRMAPLFQSTYSWGIWNYNLLSGLLWYVSEPEKAYRPEDPIAPTWSWASVCGTQVVTRPPKTYDTDVTMIKVLDLSTPDSGSPALFTATVTLRCYLIPALLSREATRIAVFINSKLKKIDCEVKFDLLPQSQGTKCFLLPFTQSLQGLILEPTMKSPTCFQRLGTFDLEGKYGNDSAWKELSARHNVDFFWNAGFEYSRMVGGEKFDSVQYYNLGSQGSEYGLRDGIVQHVVKII